MVEKKKQIPLYNTKIIVNRLLVELWMLKVLLVKAQTEMRTMLLENLTEGDPCYSVAESLAELCLTVMWKAELVSDKTFS